MTAGEDFVTTTDTAKGPLSQQSALILKRTIQSARSLDELFLDVQKDLLKLLDAKQVVIYAVDPEHNELFSRFPMDTIKIAHIPINEESLVGLAAKTLKPINIRNVYDAAEMKAAHPSVTFDSSWDKKAGFQTKQIFTFPIVTSDNALLGAIQLINKKSGDAFNNDDEASLATFAVDLGLALAKLQKQKQKFASYLDYLATVDWLPPDALDALRAEAKKGSRPGGQDIETQLIEKYKVPKPKVVKSLGDFYECPALEFDDRLLIDHTLFKTLKPDQLKRDFWVPLRRTANGIEIMIDNPNHLEKVQQIKRQFSGQNIRFLVGLRQDILQFIKSSTGDAMAAQSVQDIVGELVSIGGDQQQEDGGSQLVTANDNAIVRLAYKIIADAYRMGASDIHIEPYGEKSEAEVRYRVDGNCIEYMKIPASNRRAIVSRLKIMANLDIAERRKPQDGKIKFRLGENKEIELRVATIPTSGVGNEDIVMRILAASEPLPLDKMGFSERNLRELKAIAEKPYGIILCVGPTGSGKTTTLHSVLGYINKPDTKIWTAEDPVEITQDGLRQVQVQPKIGFTFAMAMRAFLRADPDVIMVGEMRDKETADTGIEASLTGHLVLSTLHTNSAVETVTRLLDMGCDPFSFADAMLGVLAQRLCRR
ncbi:MAG: GspE/PulE family protein, partial [Nitrospirae bacterium]|nr:GspE/PulE family protein [Nitrospirota bacterium]